MRALRGIPSDAVGHFVVAVVRVRYAVAAVSLDLQDTGVGSRRRGAVVRVPLRALVATGALAERRGVHLLELRVTSLAHGEQAAGLLVLASYFALRRTGEGVDEALISVRRSVGLPTY